MVSAVCTRGCFSPKILPRYTPSEFYLFHRQTGLDSSTTFQIVRSIANVAHFRDATILVSLLQVRSLSVNPLCWPICCHARLRLVVCWAQRFPWHGGISCAIICFYWLFMSR